MEEAMMTLVAIIVVSCAIWLRSRLQILATFRNLGIKGPVPSFIYGNMNKVWEFKKPWVVVDEWYHQYGKVFGCFPMGIRPMLVVGDREMVRDILQTHFTNFRNRPPLGPPRGEPGASSLTTLRGDRWKRVRNVISPTFTTKKIREMSESMNKAAETFLTVLDKHSDGEAFDIYAMFQALTLDVIAQAAFALSVESQTNPEDALLKVCRALFKSFFGPMMKVLLLFPEFGGLFGCAGKFLRARSGAAAQEFYVITHMRKVFHKRLEWPNVRGKDMIQLMMDASVDGVGDPLTEKTKQISPQPDSGLTSNTTVAAGHRDKCDLVGSRRDKYLTENELVANCFVFLLAGYETTANALAFSTYLLAQHPEVQERLYREIMQVLDEKEELSFEDTTRRLPYLEAVIKESLRMYPPITGFVMRECMHTCVIKGVTIPAGMAILIPVWSLHHDPDYWLEPHKFNPDRFMGPNAASIPQMAFMAFGDGPRNCIGMSFAMMEIRITIVRMLQRYRLLPPLTEEGPLELESPFVTMNPKNGVNIELQRR